MRRLWRRLSRLKGVSKAGVPDARIFARRGGEREPQGGANWRPATRRSNDGYLKKQIYPRLEHVALKDISKFQVQMLFDQLAAAGYSYNVVYHVRDIIKAALRSRRARRSRTQRGAQNRHPGD